ncbi:hypothetical protein ACNKHW_00360 [Shigella flexneri]
MLCFGITLVIEQRKTQVEAAQHFHQPLVLEAFRTTIRTRRHASEQLLMDDHPGFNGFTQTHFVRQQNTRRVAATDFMGNNELMRDQAGADAAQAAVGIRNSSLEYLRAR